MSKDKKNISRREFITGAGAAGIGSMFAMSFGMGNTAYAQDKTVMKMPTRVFGKSKIPVSILSLGGMFDIPNNQMILQKALDLGVTYWDTANSYGGGNSEIGIGIFFEKNPDIRKKVFLVTKSGSRTAKGMQKLLDRSLERMKTDYIDLYFIHGVSKIEELTDEQKVWAEKKKKEGKIKLIGFSTHGNMENLMLHAPTLGWVDGIMMKYDFRLMQKDKMKKAVDACYKAGIGLTAMKTQGGGPVKTDSEAELELAGKFKKSGYSPQQAKLKAVWQEEKVAAICSQMPNITFLNANAAAAMDKVKLSNLEFKALNQYAEKTCEGFCAGCSEICDKAMGGESKIADVMRYMMYYVSYGDYERARNCFAELPANTKRFIANADFSKAEKACPQKMAIGKIMRQASEKLV